MATQADVRRIALALPGAEQAPGRFASEVRDRKAKPVRAADAARLLVAALAVLQAAAYTAERDRRFLHERKPIAEVRHQGFRQDIPDERRGNASFYQAVFTREGNYLVTAGYGFRVWDPRTGALLRTINGTLDQNDQIVADGMHHRLLARRGGIAPHLPVARGLGIWDLRDGSLVGMIPETDREPALPLGSTARGEAVVRERRIETWALDGSGRRLAIEQVSTFDVQTGALVGRVAPPFEDWEGAFRVSADGSRGVAYRFLSDILVVIDGATGQQRGYICAYFCNRLHQPVEVPYAVSPDGRRVASGGRLGAGLWDTDADTLIAPLEDPTFPPRRPRN